ncbi:MAG: hypothetical protein ACI89E_001353 [Planctomycetota bacterium]|jgi:hypothetical protein
MQILQSALFFFVITLLCACSKEESSVLELHDVPKAADFHEDTGIRVSAPIRTDEGPHRVTWRWTVTAPPQVSNMVTGPFYWYLESSPLGASPGQGKRQIITATLIVDGQEREEGYLLRYRMEGHFGGAFGSVEACEITPTGFRIERLVAVSQAEQRIPEGGAAILASVDGNTLMLHTTGLSGRLSEEGLRSPWAERFKERAYRGGEEGGVGAKRTDRLTQGRSRRFQTASDAVWNCRFGSGAVFVDDPPRVAFGVGEAAEPEVVFFVEGRAEEGFGAGGYQMFEITGEVVDFKLQ